MKVGDLVKAKARIFRTDDVGIVVKIYDSENRWLQEAEIHWLNDLGDGVSWMHLRDLELVSDANR